jgi:hypothetical protein
LIKSFLPFINSNESEINKEVDHYLYEEKKNDEMVKFILNKLKLNYEL